jgi:signal transduction histidine kinase
MREQRVAPLIARAVSQVVPSPAAGPAVSSRRRSGGARWGLLFVAWTLIGLMFVAPTYLQFVADGMLLPWSRLFSELTNWYLWALLFPVILWVARRFPFELPVWKSRVALHLSVGAVISAVYALVLLVKRYLIIAIATGDWRPHLLEMGIGYLFGGVQIYLLIYLAILAVVHAFDYYRKLQQRELKSTRLEAKLAQAQLQVLRMQLHPHFLFNTLNAISALMHKDVDAADRMIALLSDFLRLSLDNAGQQEVTLKTELEFLERYVEIERTRFGDRLSVSIDVDPRLLDAKVPNLILQPLVENSIRHGTSRRAAAGHVWVDARLLAGNRVGIKVRDDGPGVPPGQLDALRQGVGLSNTRARIEQLYASAGSMELANGEHGGFVVSLVLPYRPDYWAADERWSDGRLALGKGTEDGGVDAEDGGVDAEDGGADAATA